MSEAMVWMLLAGSAVILELLSGTFYLLMIALGLGAGAMAAYAGAGTAAQMVCAALVGGGAVALWHIKRSKQAAPLTAQANRDVNLDIGQVVHVPDANVWKADGNATIRYRGADWSACLAPGAIANSGTYIIEQVQGSRLVLRNAPLNAQAQP